MSLGLGFHSRSRFERESVLDCLIEESYYVFGEFVRILEERAVIRPFENEYLGNSVFKELVSLYDFICSDSSKPILVSITESYWEG